MPFQRCFRVLGVLAFHRQWGWRGGNPIVVLCFNGVNSSIFRECLNQQQSVFLGIMKKLDLKPWRKRLFIFVPWDLGLRNAWDYSTEASRFPRIYGNCLKLFYNLGWFWSCKLKTKAYAYFPANAFYFSFHFPQAFNLWPVWCDATGVGHEHAI